MTTPAPITVEQLMDQVYLFHRRGDDIYRASLIKLMEQFAAEQRAQGAAELQKTLDETDMLLDRERMRLAACGVAALQNTPETVVDRIGSDNPYYSDSYQQACNAVDREMQLRAELATAKEENARLKSEQKQMVSDLTAIQKLHDEQKAKIYAELAATKQWLEVVEYDSIQRIANDVCEKLPHGFTLSLWMENGAAWVELCENELLPLNEDTESSISDQIFYALTVAIAAEAKEPCKHLRRQTHKSIVSPGVERDRCADCGELLSIGASQENKPCQT